MCQTEFPSHHPFQLPCSVESEHPSVNLMTVQEKAVSVASSTECLSTTTKTTLTPSDSLVSNGSGSWSSDEELPGFRGHLTVFGAFLALLVTFGQMNSFGTFQTWYSSHQLSQKSQSTISWIGSIQLLVFFLAVTVIFGILYLEAD